MTFHRNDYNYKSIQRSIDPLPAICQRRVITIGIISIIHALEINAKSISNDNLDGNPRRITLTSRLTIDSS